MVLLPMLAEAMSDGHGLALLGAGLGVGLVTLGPAIGIGYLGGNAVQAQARQPEVAGRIFTSMIVAAALIEGFTFFGLIICFLMSGRVLTVLEALKAGTGH